MAIAAALGALPAHAGGDATPDPRLVQLQNALALARDDSFYLQLDLAKAELSLMLAGVPLRTFPYAAAATGRPRLAFLPGAMPGDWTGRIWRDGRLEPERRRQRTEIVPAAAGADGAATPTPEPAEEPVPPRYRIRFAGGLELEIAAAAARSRDGGLADALRLLRRPADPHLRIRLELAAGDAEDLYRCLPPAVRLAVLGRPS